MVTSNHTILDLSALSYFSSGTYDDSARSSSTIYKSFFKITLILLCTVSLKFLSTNHNAFNISLIVRCILVFQRIIRNITFISWFHFCTPMWAEILLDTNLSIRTLRIAHIAIDISQAESIPVYTEFWFSPLRFVLICIYFKAKYGGNEREWKSPKSCEPQVGP